MALLGLKINLTAATSLPSLNTHKCMQTAVLGDTTLLPIYSLHFKGGTRLLPIYSLHFILK